MAGPTTARSGGPKAPKPARDAKRPKPPGPAKPSRSGPAPAPRPWFRRGPALLALAGAVLLTAGGTWVLYGSPWLRVEKVAISGTQVLTPEQVRAAAAVPLGAPLASVDTGEIALRLRGQLPRIDTVEVVRAWPHGIGLKVTERKPVLLIAKGADFQEVDASGVRFAVVPARPQGVPVLELAAQRSPSLRRFDEERLLHEAVGVAGDLPVAVSRQTRVIRVHSYDSVVLELAKGRTVVWGSSEQGASKGRALAALMKAAPAADHFDVSAPTAPAATGS